MMGLFDKLFGKKESDIPGLDYMRKAGYPEEVIEAYKKLGTDFDQEINEVRLHLAEDLQVENEDAVPGIAAAKAGYWNIASTVCGDAYCVNTNEPGNPIIMLSHENIDEEATPEDVRKAAVKIADSFDEFLERYHKGHIPNEYWDLYRAEHRERKSY